MFDFLFGRRDRERELVDTVRQLRARLARMDVELSRLRAERICQRPVRARRPTADTHPLRRSGDHVMWRVDEYREPLLASWALVSPGAFGGAVIGRVAALEPRLSNITKERPTTISDYTRSAIGKLLDEGPAAAASFVRPFVDSEDTAAVGAESILYGLAIALGDAWSPAVRLAWVTAIDDVVLALGYGSAAEKMDENSSAMSSV